jgi:hypothetical protein
VNYSYTRDSDAVSADAVSIRAFLQQAVEHYPRLVAFSFSLKLPYRETMNEYRSLILRFHTEVWLRTGEYSRQRQQSRHHSPPHGSALAVGGRKCTRMWDDYAY